MDLGLRCLSAVPMNRALALAISWRECKGIALGGGFFLDQGCRFVVYCSSTRTNCLRRPSVVGRVNTATHKKDATRGGDLTHAHTLLL